MRRDKEFWKFVFVNGSCFIIVVDEFLDQIIVNFSELQFRKDVEINIYKFFSDVIEFIDSGGMFLFFILYREEGKLRKFL